MKLIEGRKSVIPVPAHSQVEEERRLKVGSAGDVLVPVVGGVDFIDSVTTAFSTLLSDYGQWCHRTSRLIGPQGMGKGIDNLICEN